MRKQNLKKSFQNFQISFLTEVREKIFNSTMTDNPNWEKQLNIKKTIVKILNAKY